MLVLVQILGVDASAKQQDGVREEQAQQVICKQHGVHEVHARQFIHEEQPGVITYKPQRRKKK